MSFVQVGRAPWTRSDLREALEEFAMLYAERPIQVNAGGMLSPHLFAAWFAMRWLQPKAIIESGIWYGQGTWFFEQACPNATIYSIDLNLERLKYRSPKVNYFDRDFATLDWSDLPGEETALFFDDHQNAYERLKTVGWFGFKHVFFEDNYPPSRGDCYSLKKAFMEAGFVRDAPGKPDQSSGDRSIWARIFPANKITQSETRKPDIVVAPNKNDALYLRRNLRTYYEFPPIFRTPLTRWGDPWDDVHYPTADALLVQPAAPYQQIFLDEAKSYTWLCYAELR